MTNPEQTKADELKPYIDIVFDGPPSHESGRFVEVEDSNGRSIRIGEWVEDQELWRLRIPYTRPDPPTVGDDALEIGEPDKVPQWAIDLADKHDSPTVGNDEVKESEWEEWYKATHELAPSEYADGHRDGSATTWDTLSHARRSAPTDGGLREAIKYASSMIIAAVSTLKTDIHASDRALNSGLSSLQEALQPTEPVSQGGECPECEGGKKRLVQFIKSKGLPVIEACPACHGTGRLTEWKAPGPETPDDCPVWVTWPGFDGWMIYIHSMVENLTYRGLVCVLAKEGQGPPNEEETQALIGRRG